jgi:hypothetical protein
MQFTSLQVRIVFGSYHWRRMPQEFLYLKNISARFCQPRAIGRSEAVEMDGVPKIEAPDTPLETM